MAIEKVTEVAPSKEAASPNVRCADADSPWLGLLPYTEASQQFFFGRDAEVRELFLRVRDHPVTVLFGQSGLGKTSLLGAGLMPKLRADGYRPALVRLRFGSDAPPLIEQVRDGLVAAVFKVSDGAIRVPARWAGASLWELVHRIDCRPDRLESAPPVVIFDQFEEVFNLGVSHRGRVEVEALALELADLAENRPPARLRERLRDQPELVADYDFASSPLRILVTVREDFLFHLDSWNLSFPSIMRNRMALHVLSGPQALDAVVGPGRRAGRNLISDDVGEKIVRFVAESSADLPLKEIGAIPPLLNLLCYELNDARLRTGALAITAEQVNSQGQDILRNFYTRAFENLHPAVRRFIEDRMITVNGHRNLVAREDAVVELHAAGVSNPGGALDQLIQFRLLFEDVHGLIQRLEITHDVLVPLVLRSRDERQGRERAERARRKSVLWTAIAVICAILITVSIALAVSAKKGRAFVEARDLYSQATSDLNEGYQLLAKSREMLNRTVTPITNISARMDVDFHLQAETEAESIRLNSRFLNWADKSKSLAKTQAEFGTRVNELTGEYGTVDRHFYTLRTNLIDAQVILDKLDPNLRDKYSEVIVLLREDIMSASTSFEGSKSRIVEIGSELSVQVALQLSQSNRFASTQTLGTNAKSIVNQATNRLVQTSKELYDISNSVYQTERRIESSVNVMTKARGSLWKVESALNETIARLLGSQRLEPTRVEINIPWSLGTRLPLAEYSVSPYHIVSSQSPSYVLLSPRKSYLPASFAKIAQILSDVTEFRDELNELGEKVNSFKGDLAQSDTEIAALLDDANNAADDAAKLLQNTSGLSADVDELGKAAGASLAAATEFAESAEILCTEISGSVDRVKQAETKLKQLAPLLRAPVSNP